MLPTRLTARDAGRVSYLIRRKHEMTRRGGGRELAQCHPSGAASFWARLIQVMIKTQSVRASVKSGNCKSGGRQ